MTYTILLGSSNRTKVMVPSVISVGQFDEILGYFVIDIVVGLSSELLHCTEKVGMDLCRGRPCQHPFKGICPLFCRYPLPSPLQAITVAN